ncbi:MAG: sulfatase-like hydrolase/transferase [Verrucomicrobiota bacterium]|nr:sulfatase-like hydrolase/transferase [Verrucomicrobiota bacterium]
MKRWVLILFLALAAVGFAQPPNVVLIIGNDISPDFSRFGGQVQTPNINQLATKGVRFDNAYVAASSCSPSHNSITGRWGRTTPACRAHRLPAPVLRATAMKLAVLTATAAVWFPN